jgi:hypothetical protein
VSGPVLCGLSALGLVTALSGASDSLPMIVLGLASTGWAGGLYRIEQQRDDGCGASGDIGHRGRSPQSAAYFRRGRGVAAPATVLAWRLNAAVGTQVRTSEAPQTALLAAVDAVLALLAIFAAIGAGTALVRDRPQAAHRAN